MHLFYAGAELRWLMASTDWPDTEEFCDLLKAFNRAYQDAARGTRVVDVLSAVPSFAPSKGCFQSMFDDLDSSRLAWCLYDQLVLLINRTDQTPVPQFIVFDSDLSDTHTRLSPHIRELGKLEMDRVIYGTRAKNIRNSFISYRDPTSEDPSVLRAGQISQLFLHRRIPADGVPVVEPFIVVDEYIPLSAEHATQDPYRRFPLIDTKLYYDRFHERSAVIRPADILCHFAALVCTPDNIGKPCIVVRLLDRVSGLTIRLHESIDTYAELESIEKQ